MRRLLYISLAIISLFLVTCKKVTKKVNSEKMFSLIFVDSLNIPINQCYDRVWAKEKGNLENCSYSTIGLQLPLSIKADSNIFFLQKNNLIDTVVLVYKKTITPQTSEFEVFYDLTKISGSFKKTSLKCIPNLTPKCDGDKAMLSAVVFQ